MNTGERLRREREAQGLTGAELARRAGVHQTTIDKIEKRGSQNPQMLPEIATALGVRVEWLKSGRGPKHDDLRPGMTDFPWELWEALTPDHKLVILNLINSFPEATAHLNPVEKKQGNVGIVTSDEVLSTPHFPARKSDRRSIRK